MRNLYLYTFLIVLITSFFSCEKEIDLKYKHDFDRLVVEAILVKGDNSHQIRVSRESNYFELPEYIPVESIYITLEDEAGKVGTFYYIDSGYYQLDNYDLDYRMTYTLSLKDGNKVIEASCKTSSEIILDTILTTTYAENGWTTSGLTPRFQDPANEDNYYLGSLASQGLNQKLNYNRYTVFTDELIDGKMNTNSIPIFYGSGDTLTFVLRSVDYYRYQFLKTLEESYNDGGLFSASPSNPISNFKDKALGYFSVEVEDRMTVIVP